MAEIASVIIDLDDTATEDALIEMLNAELVGVGSVRSVKILDVTPA